MTEGAVSAYLFSHCFTPSAEELEAIRQQFDHNLVILTNFAQTAPPLDLPSPTKHKQQYEEVSVAFENPQTTDFCARLGVPDYMQRLKLVSPIGSRYLF